MLYVQTHSKREVPCPEAVAALMIKRYSPHRIDKITAEHKTVFVPYRKMGTVGIYMFKYQFFNTGGLKCDRSVHISVFEKAEHTAEPAIITDISLHNTVIGERTLLPRLRQCEVRLGKEVLVKGHVVVDILKTCYA